MFKTFLTPLVPINNETNSLSYEFLYLLHLWLKFITTFMVSQIITLMVKILLHLWLVIYYIRVDFYYIYCGYYIYGWLLLHLWLILHLWVIPCSGRQSPELDIHRIAKSTQAFDHKCCKCTVKRMFKIFGRQNSLMSYAIRASLEF